MFTCLLLYLTLILCGPVGWVSLALLALDVFPQIPC